MDIFILTTIGTLILVAIAAYFITKNLRKGSWEGELTDKKENIISGGEYDTTNYTLYIKLLDGSTKQIIVSKKLYTSLQVGDRLKKEQGKAYPKKI